MKRYVIMLSLFTISLCLFSCTDQAEALKGKTLRILNSTQTAVAITFFNRIDTTVEPRSYSGGPGDLLIEVKEPDGSFTNASPQRLFMADSLLIVFDNSTFETHSATTVTPLDNSIFTVFLNDVYEDEQNNIYTYSIDEENLNNSVPLP